MRPLAMTDSIHPVPLPPLFILAPLILDDQGEIRKSCGFECRVFGLRGHARVRILIHVYRFPNECGTHTCRMHCISRRTLQCNTPVCVTAFDPSVYARYKEAASML